MSKRRGCRWVLAALATILAFSGAAMALSQRSTSWSGDVAIEGPVTIPSGETLVVQPGTEISSAGPGEAALVVDGSLLLEGSNRSPVHVRVPIQASPGNDSSIRVRNASVQLLDGEGCALTLSPSQPARVENSTIAGAESGLCVRSLLHQPPEPDRRSGTARVEDFSSFERDPPIAPITERQRLPDRSLGPSSPTLFQGHGIDLHRVTLTQNEGAGLNLSSVDDLPTQPPSIQARHLAVEANGLGIQIVEGAPRLEVHNASIVGNEIGVESSGGQVLFDHATFENNREWDVLQTQGTGEVRWAGSWFEPSCTHVDSRGSYGCHRGSIGAPALTLVLGLVYGLVFLVSEAGRYLLVRIGFALRLYSRIPRDELLEDETRQRLLKMIRATPGRHLRDLVRQTGGGYGTVVYHLDRLENEGFINSQREGLYRRFYASDTDPEQRGPRGTRERVFETIAEEPGIHAAEIARKLDTSRQLVSYHVRKLVDGARIEERPAENRKRLFPCD